MKIKKVLVSSIQEGMQIITKELGEDAVILSTRTIESNAEESENKIEIIAAMDESVKKEKEEISVNGKNYYKNNGNGIKSEDTASPEQLIYADGLKFQINEIRQLLYDLSHRVKYKFNNKDNNELKKIFDLILNSEFSEDFAYRIIDELSDLLIEAPDKEDQALNENYLIEQAKDLILKNIKIFPQITQSEHCTIISFFGTTGGGKTTTLIKLAILFKIIFNSESVILSTDVNKVGAIEQLQTYSSIAAIPHYAIFSAEDLAIAIEDNKSKNFILIDTTGSSQQDKDHINELKELLDIVGEHNRFLVQSCNVGKATFREIIREYSVLNPSGIILTKLDEAAALGNIIEVLNENNIPLSYFTNGTRVPEDIEPAKLYYLKNLLCINK